LHLKKTSSEENNIWRK